MAQPLDAEDVDRIERLDMERVRARMTAARALPIPRGSADGIFLRGIAGKRAIDLSAEQRHQLAVLCWTWRRRLERGVAPGINPSDPLSPEMLARQMGCTPTLAAARIERGAP